MTTRVLVTIHNNFPVKVEKKRKAADGTETVVENRDYAPMLIGCHFYETHLGTNERVEVTELPLVDTAT